MKKQEKIVKILKYTLLIISSIYVFLQLLFIILILIEQDELSWFQTQALVIIGFLILVQNILMIVLYCRYTGTPYISDQHYKQVRSVGFVALFWSVSLIGKIVQASFPDYSFNLIDSQKLNVDESGQNNDQKNDLNIAEAALLLSIALVFDVAPYFAIADAKFIKIFTFDRILRHERRQKDLSDNENASIFRKNMDISAVDRDAVLSGKLGEEIMSLGTSSGT